MKSRRVAVALSGFVGAMACDEGSGDAGTDASPEQMPVPLVAAERWALADPALDLFADMRPAEVECDEQRGYYLYETSWATLFEVNTGWCNYVTVAQPLVEALEPGDTVEVRVYHFDLAGGPAEGYVGVGLDAEIMWETTVAIPSEGGIVKGTFEVTEAIEAGTTIQFHVHNHGSNTWELYSIDKVASGS